MSMEGVANVCVGADEAWKHNLANALIYILINPQNNKNGINKNFTEVGMRLPKSTETRGVGYFITR